MGQTVELMDRITVNPDQCGGRPCVRGMRIRVIDVLDLLATGLSADAVVEEPPTLSPRTFWPASALPAAASTIPCSPHRLGTCAFGSTRNSRLR